MPRCEHTYKQHESGFAAFCSGNPDRWYPFALVGCLGIVALAVVAIITAMLWLIH